MPLNSMEEDALFAEWGWEKDLIARHWIGPFAHVLTFDDVYEYSDSPHGEAVLKATIAHYGRKVHIKD